MSVHMFFTICAHAQTLCMQPNSLLVLKGCNRISYKNEVYLISMECFCKVLPSTLMEITCLMPTKL